MALNAPDLADLDGDGDLDLFAALPNGAALELAFNDGAGNFTGGTLVEKCCHYFNLMDLVLRERPLRVFASGGQRVNHLDEDYGGRRPDILDSAYAIVEYPSGARAMLELCMFAENSVDSETLTIVGDEGKIESLLPSLTLRYGKRADWGRRQVWGEPSGTGRGVSVRRIWDTANEHKISLRTATYAVACERILIAREERGLYP